VPTTHVSGFATRSLPCHMPLIATIYDGNKQLVQKIRQK
jgi:hypothetical protein